MPVAAPKFDPKVQREIAATLFNYVWDLLEQAPRTEEENDAMVHAAHASRHHWSAVGGPVELSIGEWQVSRVYAVLGRAEPALHHARRCREICVANAIGGFYLAFAFEALARASAVGRDPSQRDHWLALARAEAVNVTKDDDRAWLETNLKSIPIGG
ncbi:MAG: hypothetical protein HY719_04845 [Planctomycetes bacterium]|nr:hypothetical protein [Planctomycetota bacterium]